MAVFGALLIQLEQLIDRQIGRPTSKCIQREGPYKSTIFCSFVIVNKFHGKTKNLGTFLKSKSFPKKLGSVIF